jgi:hypothetical protein
MRSMWTCLFLQALVAGLYTCRVTTMSGLAALPSSRPVLIVCLRLPQGIASRPFTRHNCPQPSTGLALISPVNGDVTMPPQLPAPPHPE